MADIPAYSVAQAQQNADQSRRIAGLIFRGQATQKVNDPNAKYDPNIPDPAHVQGYGGYVDANGKWIGKTAPQIDQVTDRGPNVINMLGDAASRPNTQLNPNSNRHLNYAGDQALNMARGGAGQTFGLNQSRDAAADAAAAAGGIGTAGAANAASQAAQLGQTGQDLGAVRASALGMGPSAAEHLARSQLDSNIRAQSSLAATARGGNIASAMRGAQNAGQNMMLQSQQQMAAQRAQEQLNAQGLLTQGNAGLNNALYGARGQDVSQAGAAAQAYQGVGGLQNQIFNTNAGMGQYGVGALNNSAATYGTQMGQQTQADMNSRQAYADFLQRQYSIASGIPVTVGGQQGQVAIANQQADQQREAALFNAAASGVASLSAYGH
jgi:hypothetical protein